VSLPALPLNAWMRWDHVQRLLPTLDVRSVLEIGAGGGAVAVRLAQRYDYVGLEPDEQSFALAERRLGGRGRMVCGDVSALEPDARFDLVCAFEVLEHMEDDGAALREWRGRLRNGGWLLLSMPAHQRRFGPHDRIVGHCRRYDPDQIAELLVRNGYSDPLVLSCGFPFGYALEVGRNLISRFASGHASLDAAEQTAASGRWLQPPEWSGWLTAAIAAPWRVLQRPFARTGLGTGLVVLAQSR
jgi:SAM-dependent methyltransferase